MLSDLHVVSLFSGAVGSFCVFVELLNTLEAASLEHRFQR